MSNFEHAKKMMERIEKTFDEVEAPIDIEVALQISQVCALMAQTEALLSIATHLGNIHQALLTPDVNLEPTTVADQAKRIADALSAVSVSDGESRTVAEYLSRIDWTILNP